MRLLARVTITLFTLIAALPASAQPVDCMTEGYLASFEVAGVTDLTCVEVFRFSVATPGGERIIRGIADLNADWAFRPGAADAVEEGARLAADALPSLVNYRIGDVTILLLGDRFTPESEATPGPQVLAQAWDPDAPITGRGDCRLTAFLWGPGGITGDIPTSIAHEMFHCVQFATLSPEQMAGVNAGADWWIEGSAEYFAAFAVPDAAGTDRVGEFNDNTAAGMALNDMAYEASTFFYWFHQTRGLAALMPFLSGMAGAGDHHGAMRAALSDTEWLAFAQAWDDRAIRHPQGRDLNFGTQLDGTAWIFERTSSETTTLDPFVLTPGWANYTCGNWRNTLTPDTANVTQHDINAADWGPWPPETDGRDTGGALLRFVALNTGEATELRLRAERIASCEPCLGSTEIDRCLIGDWQLTGGGPMEWLRNNGLPVTRDAMGDLYLTLFDDGTFTGGAVGVDYQLRFELDDGPMISDSIGVVEGTTGRWSIVDGRLAGCFDSGGTASGTTTTQVPGATMTTGFPSGGPGSDGTTEYTCSDGQFTTTFPMRMGGPMVHEFSRLTPPAAE